MLRDSFSLTSPPLYYQIQENAKTIFTQGFQLKQIEGKRLKVSCFSLNNPKTKSNFWTITQYKYRALLNYPIVFWKEKKKKKKRNIYKILLIFLMLIFRVTLFIRKQGPPSQFHKITAYLFFWFVLLLNVLSSLKTHTSFCIRINY